MGMILDSFGPWTFEVRSKSIVLMNYVTDERIEWDMDDDPDDDLHQLVCALDDVRSYIEQHRKERPSGR